MLENSMLIFNDEDNPWEKSEGDNYELDFEEGNNEEDD